MGTIMRFRTPSSAARRLSFSCLASAVVVFLSVVGCSTNGPATDPPGPGSGSLDGRSSGDDGQSQEPSALDVWQPAPDGPRGPQGPRGFDGVQGVQGPTGPTGPAGLSGASSAPEYDFAIYEPSYVRVDTTPTTVAVISPSPRERLLFLNLEAHLQIFIPGSNALPGDADVTCFLRAEGVGAYIARSEVQHSYRDSVSYSRLVLAFTLQGVLPAGKGGHIDCVRYIPASDAGVNISTSAWLRSATAIAGITQTPDLLGIDPQYPWLADQLGCDAGTLNDCQSVLNWSEEGSPLEAYALARIAALQ